jgi:hypothetical protein
VNANVPPAGPGPAGTPGPGPVDQAPTYPADGLAAAAPPAKRPELLVGAAFAGGVAFALLLKRAGRVS